MQYILNLPGPSVKNVWKQALGNHNGPDKKRQSWMRVDSEETEITGIR